MNRFQKLISRLSGVETSNNTLIEAEASIERDRLKERIRVLESELESRRAEKPPVDVRIGDPSPKDSAKRKAYVAEVAGLHRTVLEPKLKQMISAAHSLIEEASNSHETDLAIKGTIYSLWELIRWGEAMVNEQVSYQSDASNPSPDKEEEN